MSRGSIPSLAFFPKKSPDRRRQRRVPIQIQVLVKAGRLDSSLLTGDINRGGLFIRTDTPRKLRELIELEIDLDDGDGPITTLAVVRHTTTPDSARESDRSPGMGVQFYGMSSPVRRRWETFTKRLFDEYEKFTGEDVGEDSPASTQQATPSALRAAAKRAVWGPDEPVTREVAQSPSQIANEVLEDDTTPNPALPTPSSDEDDTRPTVKPVMRKAPQAAIDKVRREHQRFSAEFKVKIPSSEKLHEFMTRDISAGGIFLRTKREYDVGTRVEVVVVHPETEQEFRLAGQVVRLHRGADGAPSGLGIKFTGLDDRTTADLRQFVVSGVPEDLLDVGDFLFDDDELAEFE